MPSPEPIEFKSGVLYSLDWIEARLSGIMSLQVFLGNLGLQRTGEGRMFQNALMGDEILKAMQSVMTDSKPRQGTGNRSSMPTQTTGKRGRPRKYV